MTIRAVHCVDGSVMYAREYERREFRVESLVAICQGRGRSCTQEELRFVGGAASCDQCGSHDLRKLEGA